MKKIAIALFGLTALTACKKEESKTTIETKTFMDSVSYSIGYNFGENFKNDMKDKMDSLNVDAMVIGLRNGIDSTGKFTPEEFEGIMRDYSLQLNDAVMNKYKSEEASFLAEVSKNASTKTTSSGLMYEIISEGAGTKPDAKDTTVVNYTVKNTEGKEIFPGNPPGEAARFPINAWFPGVEEGLQLMPIGSKYKFYIPSALAFGEEGIRPNQRQPQLPNIPPHSVVIFEVELLDIVKMPNE